MAWASWQPDRRYTSCTRTAGVGSSGSTTDHGDGSNSRSRWSNHGVCESTAWSYMVTEMKASESLLACHAMSWRKDVGYLICYVLIWIEIDEADYLGFWFNIQVSTFMDLSISTNFSNNLSPIYLYWGNIILLFFIIRRVSIGVLPIYLLENLSNTHMKDGSHSCVDKKLAKK